MKIPFHIVSGFLGSGKTTFLTRIITDWADKYKLGIIQNEFAPSNVDGVALKNEGKDFQLLEINNGSVFCVCLLGDFTRSLEKFIDTHHPDAIIIEASGLSDTTAIAEVIAAGRLAEKLFLASNWCIVDAPNFNLAGMMKQRLIHQIRMADVLLVNKADQAEEAVVKSVSDEIRKINPLAEIKQTAWCDADFKPGVPAVTRFWPQTDKPLARPEVNSMVIKSGKRISLESLIRFIEEWAPRSFRIKGYVNLKSGETFAVQTVFDQTEIKKSSYGFHPTELIALTDRFTFREWHRSFRNLS